MPSATKKHEQPLTRRIRCLRGLNLETTEADRGRGIVGMRKRHQRNGRAGPDVACDGDGEHGHVGHRRDGDLKLRTALIAGGALLQTGVLVDGFAAIAVVIRFCKRHGWRGHGPDAGMRNADRLGKEHPCREKAADCTTSSGTAKNHQSLTPTGQLMAIVGEGQEQCRGDLTNF